MFRIGLLAFGGRGVGVDYVAIRSQKNLISTRRSRASTYTSSSHFALNGIVSIPENTYIPGGELPITPTAVLKLLGTREIVACRHQLSRICPDPHSRLWRRRKWNHAEGSSKAPPRRIKLFTMVQVKKGPFNPMRSSHSLYTDFLTRAPLYK